AAAAPRRGAHWAGARGPRAAPASARWHSENFERPVALQDSGNDDSFPKDELDDLYSGSGSGSFDPDVALAMPTRPAVLPTMDLQPRPTLKPATSPPQVTEVPEEPSQRATTIPTPTATATDTTSGAPAAATVPATWPPPSPASLRRPHPRPPPLSPPTPRLLSTATSRPRALPRPATTQKPDISEKSTTPTPESFLTIIQDEPEMPVSGGPSGDSEVSEEETTQPDTASEAVAVGGAAAKPSSTRDAVQGSAAQLPQKSILEQKGVALFPAFLVTLLIYCMKKKDEGTYTLEEPKQASVTYQKPDKQKEFYT
ncbi:hypothetical protein FD755_007253, partial [Muntiacus reevesi]